MRKEFTPKDPERQMFKDFYELIQEHYIVEDNDDYWKALTEGCDEFVKRNPYCAKLARRLAYVFSVYQEHEYMRKRKRGN